MTRLNGVLSCETDIVSNERTLACNIKLVVFWSQKLLIDVNWLFTLTKIFTLVKVKPILVILGLVFISIPATFTSKKSPRFWIVIEGIVITSWNEIDKGFSIQIKDLPSVPHIWYDKEGMAILIGPLKLTWLTYIWIELIFIESLEILSVSGTGGIVRSVKVFWIRGGVILEVQLGEGQVEEIESLSFKAEVVKHWFLIALTIAWVMKDWLLVIALWNRLLTTPLINSILT